MEIQDEFGDVVADGTGLAGTTMRAEATVGGSPDGTVSFYRYATSDCSDVAVDETVALAVGVAETGAFAAAAGILAYIADYNGEDVGFFPASSGCVMIDVTLPF